MQGASRYRVARLLARGGMAEVLEAYVEGGEGFERRVALKRILPEFGADPSFVRGFIDEARIVSQLHHANIVGVFDFGVMDGLPFLVMDYVDGADLITLEERARTAGIGLPIEIALHVTTEVAHALHHAHHARDARGRSMGIVHRDVSPQNILLSWEGDIKLTDFGIARARRRLEATRVGVAKGKLGYMSPEQVRGGEVDGRTDVFALACVLHQMLTGRSPLDAPEEGSLPPAAPVIDRQIPEDVAKIISRAIEQSPKARHRDAAEMAEETGAALASRLRRDARTVMREWIARLSPEASAPSHKAKLQDLFQLELVAVETPEERKGSHSAGSGSAPLRRFASVIAKDRLQDPTPGVEISDSMESGGPPQQLTAVIPAPLESSGETSPSAITDTADSKKGTALGTVLHGYRLVEWLGQGAWAQVFRAEHEVLSRECAVKVLDAKHIGDEKSIKRMRREAKLLSELNHPNVVQVIDYGVTPAGAPFMMMEMLRGTTLRDCLKKTGPLAPSRAAEITRQIARGLAEAHSRDLIHRDLKPRNIMIVERGDEEIVKILDFGIARAARPNGDLTKLTSADGFLGTPAYMSPEQIRGASSVGPSTDLYALGVILHEMLSGHTPFRARSLIELVDAHLRTPPPALPPCGGLEEIALGLLAKSPEKRPANAAEVIAALDRCVFAEEPTRGMAAPPSASSSISLEGPAVTFADPASRSQSMSLSQPVSRSAARTPPGAAPSRLPAVGLMVAGGVLIAVLAFAAGRMRGGDAEADKQPVAGAPAATDRDRPLAVSASPSQREAPREAAREAPREAPREVPPPPEAPPAAVAEHPAEAAPVTKAKPPAPARGKEAAPTKPAAPSVRDLDASLASALRRRGLVEADLESIDSAQAAARRWRDAKGTGDADQIKAAYESTLAAYKAAPITREILVGKLKRVKAKLDASVGTVPKEKIESYEQRYFDLRTAARNAAGDVLEALAASVTELEAEVNALGR